MHQLINVKWSKSVSPGYKGNQRKKMVNITKEVMDDIVQQIDQIDLNTVYKTEKMNIQLNFNDIILCFNDIDKIQEHNIKIYKLLIYR